MKGRGVRARSGAGRRRRHASGSSPVKPRPLRHRGRVKKQTSFEPASPLSYVPRSYNGALVYDIATGNADKKVTEEALLLDHIMLNLTGSSSEMAYRSGISIGTTLYEIASSIFRGSQYEEYVPYLVEFLERSGYYVTYAVFPDKATFRLHGHSLYIGARMHTIEAGIISGFLSSARHAYTPVQEESCRNDRADACVFATSGRGHASTVRRDMIDRFVGHVHDRASSTAYVDAMFSQSYHALLSSSLLEQAHMETMRGIMHYIGSSLREKFDVERPKGQSTAGYVANSITLLRLGTPFMNNMRRLDIRLAFDTATSRRGLEELSIAFLNGIFGERASRAIATESNNKGAYTIRLARQPSAAKSPKKT